MGWDMPDGLKPKQYGVMNPLKTGNLNENHNYFTGENKASIKN
jgi:hypothetical protein